MDILLIYFVVGFIYSVVVSINYLITRNKTNKEYFIGVLLVGSCFWPVFLMLTLKVMKENEWKLKYFK